MWELLEKVVDWILHVFLLYNFIILIKITKILNKMQYLEYLIKNSKYIIISHLEIKI
jgi:hypothetical protein